jgi:probable phosphoglycerate mutase
VAARVVEGLQEIAAGEDESAAVARFRDAVEEITDLHRGEDVLVFSHTDVMALVIPRLSGNVRADLARGRSLPPCVPVRVDVDADGWRLDSWPGADDLTPA